MTTIAAPEPGSFVEPQVRRRLPIPALGAVDYLSGPYAPNAIRPAPAIWDEVPLSRKVISLADAVILAAQAFHGDPDIRLAWAACHIAARAEYGDLDTFRRDKNSQTLLMLDRAFWETPNFSNWVSKVFRQGGGTPEGRGWVYVDRARLLELCPPGAALNLGDRVADISEGLSASQVTRPTVGRPPRESAMAKDWLDTNFPNGRPIGIKDAARKAGVSSRVMGRVVNARFGPR